MAAIPCPFKYASGRACKGHIVEVRAFKADLTWNPGKDGRWRLSVGQPRSHYHLYCSEKGGHASSNHPDDSRMKFYGNELPKTLLQAIIDEDRERKGH